MNPLRYQVILSDFDHQTQTCYTVATLLGEHKAVAMATAAHLATPKHHKVYKVTVKPLAGEMQPHDLVDRMEW